MLTLPQIVRQIREQKPEAVPQWLECAEGVYDFGDYWAFYYNKEGDREDMTGQLTYPAAVAVVEASLWRVLVRRSTHGYGSLHMDMKDRAAFDADPLALIRALCHAIGVRLEDG